MKSPGPSPRSVASASRTSTAFPTAEPSGSSIAVTSHTTRRPARRPRSSMALGERLRPLARLHERALPDLDVEEHGFCAGGELLRHDAGGDQRHLLDGGRDVAQRVEPLVGRDEVVRLPDDRQPGASDLAYELVAIELDAKARDRLELVERPAGMAEPAAAHLRERHAARAHDRAERDRGLVADASGRVLVHAWHPDRRQVDRLAAANHRVRERIGLR